VLVAHVPVIGCVEPQNAGAPATTGTSDRKPEQKKTSRDESRTVPVLSDGFRDPLPPDELNGRVMDRELGQRTWCTQPTEYKVHDTEHNRLGSRQSSIHHATT
jgi:hypothetical protein